MINRDKNRLFFAVLLPAEVKSALASVQDVFRNAAHARLVSPAQLHITMIFLGDKIIDFGKLDVFFDDFSSSKSRVAHIWGFEWKKVAHHWVFWAQVKSELLHDLAIQLMHASKAPLAEPALHITLLRSDEIILTNEIEFEPIDFGVKEIALISSRFFKNEREYIILKKYQI